MDRLIYGSLPLTLQGQKNLALIGPKAVGLSDQVCKNVFFRKGTLNLHNRSVYYGIFLDEICEEKQLRVSCCTWNVNGGTRSRNLNEQLGNGLFVAK